MRLYYSFITLTAGWVGVAIYQSEFGSNSNSFFIDKISVLLIMFFAWGINQIINDYMGLKEDRINAPERPMVTGKLPIKPALLMSTFLLILAIIFSFYKNSFSIIPFLAGVLMNIVYSYAKGYLILGNLSFGICISACTCYTYVFLGGGLIEFFQKYWLLWLFVVIFNMIMTYFTYFKDYLGDKEAGKNTLVVSFGLNKASNFGFIISFIPLFIFIYLFKFDIFYLISAFLAVSLFLYTGFIYKKENLGKNTYFNLKYNFSALSVSQSVLVCHLGQGLEGLCLSLISIIWIFLIFSLGYKNEKE